MVQPGTLRGADWAPAQPASHVTVAVSGLTQKGQLPSAAWLTRPAVNLPAAHVTVAVSGSTQKGQLPCAAGAAVRGQANVPSDLTCFGSRRPPLQSCAAGSASIPSGCQAGLLKRRVHIAHSMKSSPLNRSGTSAPLAANQEELRHWLPLPKPLESGPAASGTWHTPARALCTCARVEHGSEGGQEGAAKENSHIQVPSPHLSRWSVCSKAHTEQQARQ